MAGASDDASSDGPSDARDGDQLSTQSWASCMSPFASMTRAMGTAPRSTMSPRARRAAVDGLRNLVAPKDEGVGPMPTSFSVDEVKETLKAGQRALKAVRVRVTGTLLVAGVVLLLVGFVAPLEASYVHPQLRGNGLYRIFIFADLPGDEVWYGKASLFAMYILLKFSCMLINAAPLRDDIWLSRVTAASAAIANLAVYVHMVIRHMHWDFAYEVYAVPVWVITSNGFFLCCYLLVATTHQEACTVQLSVWRAFKLHHFVLLVVGVTSLLGTAAFLRAELMLQCWIGFSCVQALLLVLALWPGWRFRVHSLLLGTIQDGAKLAAASIAGLLGDCSPDEVLKKSSECFRCVSADKLRFEDMQKQDPDPSLYALSEPAVLGSCDAFVSHSWSDDAPAKWAALQEWCASFRALHGREPSLWIDKFCINQTEINTDLQCLPVFLCGCRELLVLCGTTYFSRLWCIMELFTHHHASLANRQLTVRLVLKGGRQDRELRRVVLGIQRFDVEACACSCRRDRLRMIELIEAAYGSSAVFNSTIADIIPAFATSDLDLEQDTFSTTSSPLTRTSFSRQPSPS